jgi:intracellular multiplication protein IcmJ
MVAMRRQALLPLTLNVKMATWRLDDPNFREHDSDFDRVRKRALERDDYHCCFCSFRALKYQEVHHLNDDHSDNNPDNLATTCPYCHMCQHIGLWGHKKEAVLIWLPEFTQVEVNHMMRSIQVAKAWAGQKQNEAKSVVANKQAADASRSSQDIADAASAVYAAFKARQDEAERRFLTSDPLDLANVLLQTPSEVLARKNAWFHGLRLLPTGVRRQNGEDTALKWLDVWMGPGGAYFGVKPASWVGLFRNALRQ